MPAKSPGAASRRLERVILRTFAVASPKGGGGRGPWAMSDGRVHNRSSSSSSSSSSAVNPGAVLLCSALLCSAPCRTQVSRRNTGRSGPPPMVPCAERVDAMPCHALPCSRTRTMPVAVVCRYPIRPVRERTHRGQACHGEHAPCALRALCV